MSHGRGEGTTVKRGPGRPPRQPHAPFAFKTGDLVLVKWHDGMVYFAKIKRIDHKRQKCVVVFDDKSQDEAHFSQIHSVDETTTDIICIRCKKDDSDKPNEIVLCDTCGIGFHQKCHVPNIPASALELDTPWNCVYCLKGVKCPYLTESLDVLQNLLSDDEEASVQDTTKNVHIAKVDTDFEPDSFNQQDSQTPPKKKRGRKPAALSSDAKRERRKVHSNSHPHQSNSVVPLDVSSGTVSEGWKTPKMYVNEDSDSELTYLSSGRSTPEPTSSREVGGGIKRKRHHVGGQFKKQKRSSVESRTVSVTRVSIPICDTSSAEEMDTSRDSSVCGDATPVANHVMPVIKEGDDAISHQKRPRSLRVSLSIPDEVEPGTPFDKVVKARQKMSSPHAGIEAKELPSWENFASANVLKASSPKRDRPKTLSTETTSSIFSPRHTITSSVAKSTTITSSSLKTSPNSSQSSTSAFLASPLPISSSPKLTASASLSVPTMNLKTKTSCAPLDVAVTGPTSSPSSQPAAVGYSTPLHHPPAPGVPTSAPTALVVSIAQSEAAKAQPQFEPPQRKAHQPEHGSTPSQPIGVQKSTVASTTEGAPGITQPSTNSVLSLTTRPPTLPTVTAAATVQSPKESPLSQVGTTLPPHSSSEQAKSLHAAPVPRGAVVGPPQPALMNQTRPSTIASQPAAVIVSTAQSSQPPVSQCSPAPQPVKILPAPPRPSSVPVHQPAPVQAPPRPSSLPQQRLPTSTPSTEHVQFTRSQQFVATSVQQKHPSTTTPLQHEAVVPQPHRVVQVGKTGQPVLTPRQDTSASLVTPIVTASTIPSIIAKASPAALQTQPRVQQQAVAAAKQSGRDADVIITGVEAKTGVIQGPSVGYERAAVCQPAVGGRVVLVTQASEIPGSSVANYPKPVQTGGVPRAARSVDSQQVVTPVSSCPAGSLVTPVAGGSQIPVPMVPVVLATPSSSPSPQVLYHLPDRQAPPTQGIAPPPPTQVIREAPVRTPPLKSATTTARPAANSATSVIVACSPTSSSVAKSAASLPVVYSTTKPYAIVNAMPGSQIYYTASQVVQPSQADAVTLPAGSLPHPPKTYSVIDEQSVTGKQHTNDVVQKISKKIGAAFDSGNENLLVAAFEDAWKKFQANGTQYERSIICPPAKVTSGKEPPPPNAEVFSVPGTTSRVNLVRQTGSGNGGGRSKLVPKPLPASVQVHKVISPPPLSSQTQSSYVYTATADPAGQPQVYLQAVPVSPALSTNQQQQQQKLVQTQHPKVLSTGLFYPPNAGTKVPSGGPQRVIVSQSVPVVHSPATVSSSNSTSGKTQQTQTSQKRRSNKSRFCSRCGKSATYLCSGCHLEWYCGRDCQLKAWDTHAEHCKA